MIRLLKTMYFTDSTKKGDDGLYYVRSYTDDKKKIYLQFDDVNVVNVDKDGDFTFIVNENDTGRIDEINKKAVSTAIEKSENWFGKKLNDKTITSAYTSDKNISSEFINGVTKAFNHEKDMINIEEIYNVDKCSVIVEFYGLWFAKKNFGPICKLVQVRLHPPRDDEDEDVYPENYMFDDQ